MVSKNFQAGNLVWAKMKGFPPWPGKIVAPPSETKVKKSHHYVFFYGSDNHAWIADENIALHTEKLVEKYTRAQKRPPAYLNAVEVIVNASRAGPKHKKKSGNSFDTLSDKEGTTPKSKSPHSNSVTKTLSDKEGTTPKSKSPHSNSVTKKREIKKVPVKRVSFVRKNSRKRAASSDRYSTESSSFEKPSKLQRNDEDDFSHLLANIPPNSYSDEPKTESGEIVEPTLPSCKLSIDAFVDRPLIPLADLKIENEMVKKEKIEPSPKKFGFLGLGKVGKSIVKNLIQSGHSVTVWNRSIKKCEEFIKIGAEKLETPADVVSYCDITFSCMSDPRVAKSLFFGYSGVLKGLEKASNVENKGYVELTSLDPKTSQAIANEITLKGGRYLEAPLNGSRSQVVDGSLFILGAGDKTLFDDCETCFCAMGGKALFVSSDVGVACQYNIIHSMFLGTACAAIAESMGLANRLCLNQLDFLDILQCSVLNSPLVMEKARSVIEDEYTSNIPIRHIQRVFNHGLALGISVNRPMPVTAATNEVYKYCKPLKYTDHDVNSIYADSKQGLL